MMKALLRVIGVASLVGSAACLPTFDQPAAQNTVANPNNPGTSAVQGTRLEFLQDHRVAIGIGLVVFITLVNLRGVRESGSSAAP